MSREPACRRTGRKNGFTYSLVIAGEFMQLGSKENENERFKHYLEKTFKKTASLIANSCKAVCTFCLHINSREMEKSLVFCTFNVFFVDCLHSFI